MFKLKKITAITAIVAAMTIGGGLSDDAQAATMTLDGQPQCSANTATSGISTTDVTGNMGDATDCWGAFGGGNQGNDPGPGGGFQIGSDFFGFTAKVDFEDSGKVLSGENIGLDADMNMPNPGTWSFTQGAMGGNPFLIVLKQSNNPGYAVWLFDGASAASFSGTWSVAWSNTNDISHLSVYGNPSPIPLPAGGLLLITALGGLGFAARRRRKSS